MENLTSLPLGVCEEEKPLIDADYLYDSYLIKEYTGKSIGELMNDYTVPELIRLMSYLDFIKSL